ncbi:hypothetical protein OS242_07085 [Tumebacillus sp. DT12]|uniref:Uncharacterized protein n=1 Tax=Tumebacillus lacus TaxID=2995335 RepID=A0ABT3X2C5_9BACL|nr:hypothetical protein [Tumebacillus lacus]MCX7569725.1 hypothetical protein [Tumebacillus lacus]
MILKRLIQSDWFLPSVIGVWLGIQHFYGLRLGMTANSLLIWFLLLTGVSIWWAKRTGDVRSGVVAGVVLWAVAFTSFLCLLIPLKVEHGLPFGNEVLIGYGLVLFVGCPVSWLCSWLTVKYGKWSWWVPIIGLPVLYFFSI